MKTRVIFYGIMAVLLTPTGWASDSLLSRHLAGAVPDIEVGSGVVFDQAGEFGVASRVNASFYEHQLPTGDLDLVNFEFLWRTHHDDDGQLTGNDYVIRLKLAEIGANYICREKDTGTEHLIFHLDQYECEPEVLGWGGSAEYLAHLDENQHQVRLALHAVINLLANGNTVEYLYQMLELRVGTAVNIAPNHQQSFNLEGNLALVGRLRSNDMKWELNALAAVHTYFNDIDTAYAEAEVNALRYFAINSDILLTAGVGVEGVATQGNGPVFHPLQVTSDQGISTAAWVGLLFGIVFK